MLEPTPAMSTAVVAMFGTAVAVKAKLITPSITLTAAQKKTVIVPGLEFSAVTAAPTSNETTPVASPTESVHASGQ